MNYVIISTKSASDLFSYISNNVVEGLLLNHTVWPRSLYLIDIVSYYIKWVKPSCTYSIQYNSTTNSELFLDEREELLPAVLVQQAHLQHVPGK